MRWIVLFVLIVLGIGALLGATVQKVVDYKESAKHQRAAEMWQARYEDFRDGYMDLLDGKAIPLGVETWVTDDGEVRCDTLWYVLTEVEK